MTGPVQLRLVDCVFGSPGHAIDRLAPDSQVGWAYSRAIRPQARKEDTIFHGS
jgi:hypothetical protein